jgi:hypothetical protein
MKATEIIILLIIFCSFLIVSAIWVVDKNVQEIKHHQQNTQYYSIPELDCYCQIHHVGKQDIFIGVQGDTVAIINRK